MAKEDYFCKGEDEPWRVLEFYSGIGGMRYSIMKAGISATIVKAFDINDKANDVYEHNFGHRPFQPLLACAPSTHMFHWAYIMHSVASELMLRVRHEGCELGDNLQGSWHYKAPKKISWNFAGNIQSLTTAVLDNYGAHAWLLSPPCQPYTRQGLQKDSDDARASSFLKILDLIAQMSSPPLMLFVENVVGFETSDTHNQMMQIFAETGFVTQEFILSPLQFGIPYSRPRYFCLAKRIPLSFQNPHFNHHLHYAPGLLLGCDDRTWTQELDQPHEMWEEGIHACEPISKFLEFGTAFHKSDNEQSYLTQYMVPQSLIERWASVMDIVYPDSRRCCCFTKSYYRYVKGTGSLLMTMQYPSSVTFQAESNGSQASSLKEKGLRYFTPREVANLHSFPESFQFPEHISLRQRYALLGNSLSVAVVGPLLHYLFTETSLQTR